MLFYFLPFKAKSLKYSPTTIATRLYDNMHTRCMHTSGVLLFSCLPTVITSEYIAPNMLWMVHLKYLF